MKNIKKEIAAKLNLKNYDSVKIGQYVETSEGEFVCVSKPNLYQPIDQREWVFEQCTDADGEPFMSGKKVIIK